MKNREKILLAARRLFNEHGFVNVRLQHISDDTIISVGNIAYHFKNKEAIIINIFEELKQRQREVFIEYRHTPIFVNVDRIFQSMESLQNQYNFFYTDIIEIKRAYPQVFEKIKQFFQWQVLLFQEIIRFNIARGAIQKVLSESEITFLSSFIIQNMNAWKSFHLIWQEQELDGLSLSSFVWKMLIPYMTDSGKEEYSILENQKVNLPIEK
ncbi:MAG: TetR/AcrR family transcriptional regulator [Bacteroidota bacterium]